MRKLLLGLFMSFGLAFGLSGSAAAAWNPFGGVDCNAQGSGNSAVCKDSQAQASSGNNNDPLTGSDGLIIKIANVVAAVAGIAAVIIIILAGMRMVTSGGSSEDITGGRRTIIYALVGLVVIVLARAIVGLILGML